MGFFGKMFGDEEETEDDKSEEESTEEAENKLTEETYPAEVICWNCREVTSWDIDCGKTVAEFLKDEKCDICGFNLIKPDKEEIK